MLLIHSFLKHFKAQDDFKLKSEATSINLTRIDHLKEEHVCRAIDYALHSKTIFLQKEQEVLSKTELLNKENHWFNCEDRISDFLNLLKDQALLFSQKNINYKYKEQTLRVTNNTDYLCDIIFVFLEEENVFQLYLSVDNKEASKNGKSYIEKLGYISNVDCLGAVFNQFKYLDLILNNYNLATKNLNEFHINRLNFDLTNFLHMVNRTIYSFSKNPTLFLGEFKVAEANEVYEKICSLYSNKTLQKLKKKITLGSVIKELSFLFNIDNKTLSLFEFFYLIGNSKTIYNQKLTHKITLNSWMVSVERKKEIEKLLTLNQELNEILNNLKKFDFDKTYSVREKVEQQINQNLNEINQLSLEKNGEKFEELYQRFSKIVEELECKQSNDHKYLDYLLLLRLMNFIDF